MILNTIGSNGKKQTIISNHMRSIRECREIAVDIISTINEMVNDPNPLQSVDYTVVLVDFSNPRGPLIAPFVFEKIIPVKDAIKKIQETLKNPNSVVVPPNFISKENHLHPCVFFKMLLNSELALLGEDGSKSEDS